MQTVFDTIVLALVLFKARNRGSGGIIALIVKQGFIYYLCVCLFSPFKERPDLTLDPKIELGSVPHLDPHACVCTGSCSS